MKASGFLLFGIAGLIGLGAAGLPAAAGSNEDWLSTSAFRRAQENTFSAGEIEDEPNLFFFERQPRLFDSRKNRRAYDRRRRNRFFDFFDNFDPEPEPDLSILKGKPKSPDDGFGIYRPAKLVSLSDPQLSAPKPDHVIASTILFELRQPQSPLSVTAEQRDAIINFYRLNGFSPLWVNSEGLVERSQRLLALLADAEAEGLNPLDYLPPTLGSFSDDGRIFRGQVIPLARLDIALTAMALRFAEHIHSGRIIPKKLSGYYDLAPPSLERGKVLYELSYRRLPDLYLASLRPQHQAYRVMKSALADLRAKLAESNQESVPAGQTVKPGGRDARVPLVRERLVKLGHLTVENSLAWIEETANAPDAATASDEILARTLDRKLSAALKKFQASRKIKQTGRLDKATVEALNMRSDQRNIQKLVMNMERLRWLPGALGERHIFVNQAAFELRIIDSGSITWSTKVIVGKPETQTAVFSDEMETVVLNPYWGVPRSIIKYEMMPYLVNDPSYLDRKGFEVVNSKGEVVSSSSVDWWAYGDKIPYDVRQPPGDDNALGNIKFLFPNSHDIYMHDTPTKNLFAERARAFSHGCVRVENPRKLAEFVLGWDRAQIDDMIATGMNQDIALKAHIPVHLNYFTAWPDASGKIAYHPDVYNRDTRLEKALNTIAMAAN
jgi:murein L,D-transpeptidase YcbB/YkuD